MLLSHTHHVGVNNTMQHTMKPPKYLHVRIPHDFHQQLVKYAEDRFIPVSSVVLQAVAKVIDYTPKPATTRSVSPPPVEPQYWDGTKYISSPKAQAEEHYTEITMDEFTDMDFDLEALQRRAAAAPIKPV